MWTASFLGTAEAAEVVFIAGELPSDQYLDFLSKEVMRTLQPYLDEAKKANQRVAFKTQAGARYYLKNLSNDQLLKENRDRLVLTEMLLRPGFRDEHRRDAIRDLAKVDQKPELRVIMDAITGLDAKQSAADPTVVFDLVRQLTGRSASELATARMELEKLATSAKQPIFRQIGFVSLINVDGNVDQAWTLATTDVKRLQDFVAAMPLISDASVRATLYDKVLPLLSGLPESLGPVAKAKGTFGRVVRVELPRPGTLTLAEVEVFSGGENVARRGRASQKNTAHGGDAQRAIDGNKSPIFAGGGQTHTEENTGNPFWEVDLGEERAIDQVVIYNRAEELGSRLQGFTLKVLDAARNEVFKLTNLPAPATNSTFEVGGGGAGVTVRRAAMMALTHVRGQELKTFHALKSFVRDNDDRTAAIRAMQRLPRTSWPKEEARPLLDVLLTSIEKTPAAQRTQPATLDALEFADALTTLLPAEDAKKTRAQLSELGVRVIRLGTIFEKMTFDKDVLAVRAGKPVEFILENSDLMPHNFAILQPGSLEEIGLLSETSAQQPGFAERHYIPDSPKVLLKSTLLQPRDVQKLSFVAPTAPGVYPFVCTYPGHWRRMYGALYVVDDLDGYLAAPEEYIALARLDPKDLLLKDRRPRTEWKLEDLASATTHLSGRSFGNGKQIFTVANCVACHRMENTGSLFGPDLTKLDPKPKLPDMLKDILEPSFKLNEKFKTEVFELGNGKVVVGLVVEQTPDVIKVVENPLAKAEPTILKRGDIVERTASKLSLMPKGLLDKLTRDEILDLLAYVYSGGVKTHAVFQAGGHDHGH